MIEFSGRALLLDVEGTTSSVRFVYDVMFPFARRELDAYLRDHWGEPALQRACEQIAREAGTDMLAAWLSANHGDWPRLLRDEALRLMDADAKTTGLKELQGLIWRSGFESGELRAHIYDDTAPALEAWHAAGRGVRIYSSGSTTAQRLFFGHTERGDLLHLIDGHYDTTTGPKREPDSYTAITADFGFDAGDILFVSDVVSELDAARAAGLRTALCIRPGNAQVEPGHGHAEIRSFAEIRLS